VGTRRNGGYADYLLAPHAKYLVPYDGVDEAFAATAACSGITAYSALKKLKHLTAKQSTLIIGAGGVGLAGIGMAKAILNSKIIVADIDPAKRKAAIALGADEVIDNKEADAAKKLMNLTDGWECHMWLRLPANEQPSSNSHHLMTLPGRIQYRAACKFCRQEHLPRTVFGETR
jgi:D-arabinose 1-dehydrogenase-like Zn-dependent alcohol dehydrogenase